MNFHRQRPEEPEINLIPFIDVLLVILIFLMLSTTYSRFTELQVNLPTANAEKLPERPGEIIVAVSGDGRYSVRGELVDGGREGHQGGRALDVATSMNSAVREGGRLASMDWKGVVSGNMTANQKVISDIRNFLVASGLPGNDMTISITHAEGASEGQTFVLSDPENRNKLFKIQVAVPYSDVSNLPATFMKDQSLVASIVLRAGRVTLID